MSEKIDALEGQLSDKSGLLSVLRSFTEHPGWEIFSKMLEAQQNGRKGEVLLQPLSGDNAVYKQEFMKGEISGLALAQVAPFTQIEVLKLEVKTLQEQLERENELEARISDVSGRSRVDDEQFFGGDEQPDASSSSI